MSNTVRMESRVWLAVQIVIVLGVLLAARELTRGIPYRNAIFMAATLIAIVAIVWRSGEGLKSLGLGAPESWKRFAIWTAIALAGTVVIGLLLYPLIASWLPAPEASGSNHLGGNKFITLVAVGWFAAAFGEEVTFRGFILPRLTAIFGGSSAAWVLAIGIVGVRVKTHTG